MMYKIEHIEIPSKNLAESMEFYSNAFGWECKMLGETYGFFKGPDGTAGGFDPTGTPSSDSGIVPYIGVEDIEATLSKIESLGGKTFKHKTEIGDDMGFYGMFTDPHGNRFGLWSAQ